MKERIAFAALFCVMAAPAAAEAKDKPALLIVGTPHFGQAGSHIVNLRVSDVTTPERQREIEAIVEKLAAFRPTRVAVEWPASEQARSTSAMPTTGRAATSSAPANATRSGSGWRPGLGSIASML